MRLEDLRERKSSDETPDQRFRALVGALAAHGTVNHAGDLEIRRAKDELRVLVPGEGHRAALVILRPGLARHNVVLVDWWRAPAFWAEKSLALDLREGYRLDGAEAGSATVLARQLKRRLKYLLAGG